MILKAPPSAKEWDYEVFVCLWPIWFNTSISGSWVFIIAQWVEAFAQESGEQNWIHGSQSQKISGENQLLSVILSPLHECCGMQIIEHTHTISNFINFVANTRIFSLRASIAFCCTCLPHSLSFYCAYCCNKHGCADISTDWGHFFWICVQER